jgi:hypothetical protein
MVGHLTLLVILLRRRIAARLPLFSTLIAFYLLHSIVLLATNPRHLACWHLIYLDPILQFLVVITLVFKPWRAVLNRPPAAYTSFWRFL